MEYKEYLYYSGALKNLHLLLKQQGDEQLVSRAIESIQSRLTEYETGTSKNSRQNFFKRTLENPLTSSQ